MTSNTGQQTGYTLGSTGQISSGGSSGLSINPTITAPVSPDLTSYTPNVVIAIPVNPSANVEEVTVSATKLSSSASSSTFLNGVASFVKEGTGSFVDGLHNLAQNPGDIPGNILGVLPAILPAANELPAAIKGGGAILQSVEDLLAGGGVGAVTAPSAAELAAAKTATTFADAVASGDTAAAQAALKELTQSTEGQAYLQTLSKTANNVVQNAQALGLTPTEVAGAQNVAKITNLLGNVGARR